MKILYLISSLHYGGAEKQTIIDANFMAINNKVFLGYFYDGPQKEIIDPEVIVIKINKTNYLFTAINIARLVKQNKIQVIHCSLFSSMIISAISSLFCKVKIIWHFHSHEYNIPFIHKMAFKYLSYLPSVKKICFVSRELINHFQKKGFNFPFKKITLLYNTATVKTTNENKNNKNENDRIIIGFIGRLVPLKRVEYLIELAQYLVNNGFKNFHIMIVGDGESRTVLENESIRNKLQDYISFEGFQKDIEKYYRNFDLFVNPSREECLSIALIDAGMCGIASVAFNAGGNNEIIINGETGYIVNTKEELFENVFLLVMNKPLRKKMGEKAKEYCRQKFGQEIHLQKLLSLYNEVLRK
ncbi:MAG TPA: glycosyltransferase family 4 protein [Bacteroidales bacterium]|nr:glycosyltransferase family 4 protein [Bacteroidales bacterium]